MTTNTNAEPIAVPVTTRGLWIESVQISLDLGEEIVADERDLSADVSGKAHREGVYFKIPLPTAEGGIRLDLTAEQAERLGIALLVAAHASKAANGSTRHRPSLPPL